MTEDQSRELFREHCQPGNHGGLERYGERAAVAAIMAAVAATNESAARTAEAYARTWREEDNSCHVEVDYVAQAIRGASTDNLKPWGHYFWCSNGDGTSSPDFVKGEIPDYKRDVRNVVPLYTLPPATEKAER